MGYCSIADLRTEGVPDTGYGAKDDAYLTALITRISRMIDLYTGRFFEPRSQTLSLDGTGGRSLLIGDPIIEVTSITLDTDVELDLNDVRIYNRHLTENLTNPDDRDSPKIELYTYDLRDDLLSSVGSSILYELFFYSRWPEGTQNIEVVGYFGYTDYAKEYAGTTITAFADAGGGQVTVTTSAAHGYSENDKVTIADTTNYNGTYTVTNVTSDTFEITATFVATETGTHFNARGVTPLLIQRAAVLMALRDLRTAYSESDSRDDDLNRWRVTELKTRDQSIKYDSPSSLGLAASGPFTGDPQIDQILLQYLKPPNVQAV